MNSVIRLAEFCITLILLINIKELFFLKLFRKKSTRLTQSQNHVEKIDLDDLANVFGGYCFLPVNPDGAIILNKEEALFLKNFGFTPLGLHEKSFIPDYFLYTEVLDFKGEKYSASQLRDFLDKVFYNSVEKPHMSS